MKSTVTPYMSIFDQFFDRSGVYVDFIDAFVTCVQKTAEFRHRSAFGDIVTARQRGHKLGLALIPEMMP